MVLVGEAGVRLFCFGGDRYFGDLGDFSAFTVPARGGNPRGEVIRTRVARSERVVL